MLNFDRLSQLRAHHFGEVSEIAIGTEVATLLCETSDIFLCDATDVAEGVETS